MESPRVWRIRAGRAGDRRAGSVRAGGGSVRGGRFLGVASMRQQDHAGESAEGEVILQILRLTACFHGYVLQATYSVCAST
jgi:hypothetical protein